MNDYMVDLIAKSLVQEINSCKADHQKHHILAKALDDLAKTVTVDGYTSDNNFGWKE